MLNIVGLLIIIALSVITTIYGASMDDDTLILTNTLSLHAINIIYSILVVGFICASSCRGIGKALKVALAVIAFIVVGYYASSFILANITYEPQVELMLSL